VKQARGGGEVMSSLGLSQEGSLQHKNKKPKNSKNEASTCQNERAGKAERKMASDWRKNKGGPGQWEVHNHLVCANDPATPKRGSNGCGVPMK